MGATKVIEVTKIVAYRGGMDLYQCEKDLKLDIGDSIIINNVEMVVQTAPRILESGSQPDPSFEKDPSNLKGHIGKRVMTRSVTYRVATTEQSKDFSRIEGLIPKTIDVTPKEKEEESHD